jgi:hypothetical protein
MQASLETKKVIANMIAETLNASFSNFKKQVFIDACLEGENDG